MATKENQSGNDETIENEAPQRTGIDALIEHYKDESGRRETIPTAYLYKYDNEKSGTDFQQVGFFTGEEIPNPHEIGLRFGSGRYGIKLYSAKGKAKEELRNWCSFKIHAVYDTYKAERDAEKRKADLERMSGTPAAAAAAIQPQDTTAQSFFMAKELIAMITPLITRANAPAPAPRQESPAEMFNSYQMMQKLLKANLFDTAETLKQFSRRYTPGEMEIEDAETEPQEKEKSTMEKIIELIEPFFNLIANKSPAAALAAQGLRSAPQFAEVLNDPGLCRMIIQHFDRSKGRAASDIALKNMGIDRGKFFAQLPAAGQPTAPRQTPQRAAQPAGNGNNGKTIPKGRGTATAAATA